MIGLGGAAFTTALFKRLVPNPLKRLIKLHCIYPLRYRGSQISSLIGQGHHIGRHCVIEKGVSIRAESFALGDYSYIRSGTTIEGAWVQIGKFCMISNNAAIVANNHRVHRLSTYEMHHKLLGGRAEEDIVRGRVELGHNVWVGTHAVILPGVYIGHGAVIGAGSVVTKDVPPFAIAVGSPAQIQRWRFPEDQIEALLSVEWWDWPEEKIRRNAHLFNWDLAKGELPPIRD